MVLNSFCAEMLCCSAVVVLIGFCSAIQRTVRFFLAIFPRKKMRKSGQVNFRCVCDKEPRRALVVTPHLRLELPSIPAGTQQPLLLRNNPAYSPNGVSMQSRHFCGGHQEHCALWLGTGRSRIGESRKTIVLPSRHPEQPSDIFRHPPTTPGTFGPCVTSKH